MSFRLKNNINDILIFFFYHFIFLSCSTLALVSFKYDISLKNVDALVKALLNFQEIKKEDLQKSQMIRPSIINLQGHVKIAEINGSDRIAIKGDLLKEGMSLITGKSSFALINFDGDTPWQLRVTSNTQVNIDDLMAERGPEKSKVTLFNLIKGGLILSITKKNQNDRFEIRNSTTVFAVRGTKFSVIKDEDSVALAVLNGVVAVENLINGVKSNVSGGEAYVASSNGRISLNKNEEIINKFDWNITSDSVIETPDLSELKNLVVSTNEQTSANPQTTTPIATTSSAALPLDVEEMITKFKQTNTKLEEDIKLAQFHANKLENEIKENLKGIEEDISCLQNSKTGCNLKNEKLILSRGFPRTWGSPSLRMSIVEDLKKYAEEKKTSLDDTKTKTIELENLLQRRNEALSKAESLQRNGHKPEEIKLILEVKDLSVY